MYLYVGNKARYKGCYGPGFCGIFISELSVLLKLPQQDIYDRLKHSGILHDYIVPSYDVLHTFSFRFLMEDLSDYMYEKGVLSDRCLEEMWKEYDKAE